jgi:O-antigen ligase
MIVPAGGYYMPDSLSIATKALIALILLSSGLVDLPRAVPVGPVTAQAILTIVYFLGGLFLLIIMPSRARSFRGLPLGIFLVWAMVSLTWTTTLSNGVQNVLAVGTLVVLIPLGEAAVAADPSIAVWLEKQTRRSVLLAVLLYGTSVAIFGAGSDDILSARAFGLYALFGVAVELAAWRYGKRMGLLWATLITILIGISQSRLALGIAVTLFPLAQMPAHKIAKLAKTIVVLAVATGLSAVAFLNSEALQQRFLTGDTSLRIGSIGINGSGRAAFWRLTMDSIEEAPILGKGAGSAEGLVESVYGAIRHPHDDYLRITHDYGLVGLLMWIVAIGSLVFSLWQKWRAADGMRNNEARICLGALLSLVGFTLQMTAENSMVYVMITAPVGLLVGSAFGVRRVPRRRVIPMFSGGVGPSFGRYGKTA